MPAHLPASAGVFGDTPTPPPRARRVFNLPPCADFSYVASPVFWDVFKTDVGHEILPALTCLRYYPGQGGVRQVKNHEGKHVGEPTAALARLASLGKIPVPRDWLVECFDRAGKTIPRTAPGYTHRINGRRGAIHLDVWTRPYSVGDHTYTEKDQKGWWIFLRRVRDELLNGGPDPSVSAGLRVKLETMARISGDKAHSSPSAKRTTDLLSDKLTAFHPPKKGRK